MGELRSRVWTGPARSTRCAWSTSTAGSWRADATGDRRVDRDPAVWPTLLLVRTRATRAKSELLLQSRVGGRVRRGPAGGCVVQRSRPPASWPRSQNSRPALTCIIGARRAWIVPMISSTSIPCR
jgi:hypothetical protein